MLDGWKNVALVLLGTTFAGTGILQAADFKGAEQVLREATLASPTAKEKPKDPYAQLREKLKAFETEGGKLPPGEAAKQWLALVDEFGKQSDKAGAGRAARPLQMEDVMRALPPPAAWKDLEGAIEARATSSGKNEEKRMLGLRLIAHTLTQNSVKRTEDLKALGALAKRSSDAASYEFDNVFTVLNEAILASMDDPEAILRMLESQIAETEESLSALHVPNLVVLVGPAKTEAFLRRALKGGRSLEIEAGTPTHKLATKLAIEMVNELPHPQWGLVNSLDAVDLFEALDKKFNQSKKETATAAENAGFFKTRERRGWNRDDDQARLYYFLGLIARNRIADAIKTAQSFDRNNNVYFPPDLIKEMERAGLTQQLNSFFATLLKDSPDAPFWNEYVSVAAHAGHAEEALALVRKTLERSDLSAERRGELEGLVPTALLANDEIDAGIAELRRRMTNERPAAVSGSYRSYGEFGPEGSALLIAKIGKLLNRQDLTEEGIKAAEQKAQSDTGGERVFGENSEVELADFLSEAGRGTEAEEVLGKALGKAVQASSRTRERSFYTGYDQGTESAILAELAKVYYESRRYDDVVWLLDNAEYWGVKDVGQLRGTGRFSFGGSHAVETPTAFYAAAALAKTGKKQPAEAVLDQLLERSPGLDRLYELLLELEPADPVTRLDELFARDQFEERPLIWKAYWLRTHGKLEEAEAAARKAISIDPSDGEEGPGDRMRAYAELAEIRAARGDQKEADFFRGAVAAIRESEMADRLHEAGLLKRAVKMYEDSLTHFADAYCIQSRLAIQLADLGLHEQAEEHYRKAYELMPESFGRVESHCFGCERAFEGERAQSIAERVFTQLAEKAPNKPQVHYLLGYLREEQDRPKEAVEQYRVAVKLDSDYLNAWHKLAEMSKKTVIPAAERDAIAFNLIRLDPRGRHGGFNFDGVTDLAGLWEQVTKVRISSSTKEDDLYPLAVSKKKLEQKANQNDTADEMQIMNQAYEIREERDRLTPAKAVMANSFLRAGMGLISPSREMVID
jgi:tetratricopeptide (TPR) repeat protein